MKIEMLDYDDLTDYERSSAPNNGFGKEVANYMRVTFEDGTTYTNSDAMEPEDATFTRDLSWIAGLLTYAYLYPTSARVANAME